MVEITHVIEAWTKLLRGRAIAEVSDRDSDAEQSMLAKMISSATGLVVDSTSVFSSIRVDMLDRSNRERCFCVQQKGGGIFCQQRKVQIQDDLLLKVQLLEYSGEILDGVTPYAEIPIYGGFILEPISNLRIYIDAES